MKTRNPTQYLIQKFKEEGVECIVPISSVRFVKSHLEALPEDWQDLTLEPLVKRIRETCERGVSGGFLKRKRNKNVSGYVYEIVK